MSGWQKPLRGVPLNKAHPLAKGLVGCWPFNEATGLYAHDYSGNANHGTLYNMSETNWRGGNRGHTLYFNGIDTYVDCGNGASLNTPDATTIAEWVHPTGPHENGIGGIWWDRSASVRNRILIYDDGSVHGRFLIGGVDKQPIAPAGSVPLNVWTHVALTYDGSEIVIWINKVKQAPMAASGTIGTSSLNRRVGMGHTTFYNFHGLIEITRIWNRALSTDEVQWLYREPYDMFEFDGPEKYFLQYFPPTFQSVTAATQDRSVTAATQDRSVSAASHGRSVTVATRTT